MRETLTRRETLTPARASRARDERRRWTDAARRQECVHVGELVCRTEVGVGTWGARSTTQDPIEGVRGSSHAVATAPGVTGGLGQLSMRWWGVSGTAVHWDGSGSAQEFELMLSPLPWGALRDAKVMRALARLVGLVGLVGVGAGASTARTGNGRGKGNRGGGGGGATMMGTVEAVARVGAVSVEEGVPPTEWPGKSGVGNQAVVARRRRELGKAAEDGDCAAQFALGLCYLAGLMGRPERSDGDGDGDGDGEHDGGDHAGRQALYWWRQAAQGPGGYPPAQCTLAERYEEGWDGLLPRAPQKAVYWYAAAAAGGLKTAASRLQRLICDSEDVEGLFLPGGVVGEHFFQSCSGARGPF
jgi:hypothetical protein